MDYVFGPTKLLLISQGKYTSFPLNTLQIFCLHVSRMFCILLHANLANTLMGFWLDAFENNGFQNMYNSL